LRRLLRYRSLVVSEAVRMKNKIAGLLMETGALYVKEKLHRKTYFANNRWVQTMLIEAAKLAPRRRPQLAALHTRELERGHRNRAALAVARKLVSYLLAVDKSRQPFQIRSLPEVPKAKAA
jgi:hypothetical protein